MKTKELTPKQIRRKLISQVIRFQILSKEIKFVVPVSANLRTIINGSASLKKIRWITSKFLGEWKKDDLDLEKWIELAEKLRKAYIRLIFATGFITDEEIQRKLDEVPLALADIINGI